YVGPLVNDSQQHMLKEWVMSRYDQGLRAVLWER
ncbi:hypothetical protein KIS1582_3122, partial [Cytobacillus firmus]